MTLSDPLASTHRTVDAVNSKFLCRLAYTVTRDGGRAEPGCLMAANISRLWAIMRTLAHYWAALPKTTRALAYGKPAAEHGTLKTHAPRRWCTTPRPSAAQLPQVQVGPSACGQISEHMLPRGATVCPMEGHRDLTCARPTPTPPWPMRRRK
jgi:hypothetical protein